MREEYMKKFLKAIAEICIFILFFAAAGYCLNGLLRHKWSFEEDNATQQIVQGYYKEEENTLDVLYLGASTIRNGISPLEIFHEYGITGYSRATSVQTPQISYYLLLETLEKQDIKAVVMDATVLSSAFDNVQSMPAKIHEALDYMPMSEYKQELIEEIAKEREVPKTEYLLPILTYHDRWEELGEQDFIASHWTEDYVFKGQYPSIKTKSYKFAGDFMQPELERCDSSYTISQSGREYFKKMIKLCKEKKIKFILLKTPTGSWDWGKHDTINAFAKKQKVDYIDLCLPERLEEIGFQAETDFNDDGTHVNIGGANKISHYVGQYLKDSLKLEDKRENEKYDSWKADYEDYQLFITDYKTAQQSDFLQFLSCLDNENYEVMISTRNDSAKYATPDVEEAFAKLGLDGFVFQNFYQSYLALLDGGKVIFQQGAVGSSIQHSESRDGVSIDITSFAHPSSDNFSEILLNGRNYSPDSPGFNIVVYNKKTGMLVCKKNFNTGYGGKAYTWPAFEQDADFEAYHENPLDYMECLKNERYFSVLAISYDAARMLPDAVVKKLQELGLEGFRGRKRQPYIAMLHGKNVLCEKFGEENGMLSESIPCGDFKMQAVSSCQETASFCKIKIAGYETEKTNSGLYIVVYDTLAKHVVDEARFSWKTNYFSKVDFNAIEDLKTYLETAEILGYDTICQYYPGIENDNKLEHKTKKTLTKNGFEGFTGKKKYIAVKKAGELLYEKESKSQKLDYMYYCGNGKAIELKVRDKKTMMTLDEIAYNMYDAGVTTIIYDQKNGAILSMRAWP